MMRFYSAFFVLLFVPLASHAQQADELFTRLLSARSIRCEFGKGTQASWDGGKLKLKESDFEDGGKQTFDSIDAKAGKARIIGNVGAGDVLLLVTTAGLTFVEKTSWGNINFTTVFADYESSSRFIAVTSRHQNINGPFPSQYHGTCSILE